ncbi:PIN domain-containing protein [Azohydromonas aeria]|uniref:PIN domain-containing protein n=1 Tax=Azohydromonas aeria TaxID=2590212 RepID=UPI0012F96B24|nr:PIN domain-containing protein [Azohydromonas aeria]
MTGISVAIDSNLLLLFVVGSASRGYIARHKRLKAFDVADFDLLLQELSVASTLVLTPNTLTETSNLIDHIGEPARGHIYRFLRALLQRPEAEERYVPGIQATASAELPRLGLTDCTLLELCDAGVPLITVDLPLFLAALSRGAKAINFNHLRDAAS